MVSVNERREDRQNCHRADGSFLHLSPPEYEACGSVETRAHLKAFVSNNLYFDPLEPCGYSMAPALICELAMRPLLTAALSHIPGAL